MEMELMSPKLIPCRGLVATISTSPRCPEHAAVESPRTGGVESSRRVARGVRNQGHPAKKVLWAAAALALAVPAAAQETPGVPQTPTAGTVVKGKAPVASEV